MSNVRAVSGDVFETDLPVPMGSEAGYHRPVIIFQAPELAGLSTVLCVPVTTNMDRLGILGSLAIARGDGGLRKDSVAQCHLLRALDKKHLRKRLGTLQPETVEAVADAILSAFGITVRP